MLKHILAGQPSSAAGSRLHQHNDYLAPNAAAPGPRDHFHHPQPGLHAAPGPQPRAARAQSSADVYDNLAVHGGPPLAALGQRAGPQLGHRHHPLNHSQLSVNNLAQRLNASQHAHGLNLSTLSTSKHSVNSASPVVGAHLANYRGQAAAPVTPLAQQAPLDRSKVNGGLDISRISRATGRPTPSPAGPASAAATATATTTTTTTSTGPSIVPLNASWTSSSLSGNQKGLEAGVKEMLTSLGLLCLVSLLLALLSLTFLVRISSVSFQQPLPNGLISVEEFAIVYDVTLVLCALALSLNLCCLLVCAIQFLFAVKLVKSSYHGHRTNKYLQKSSISRVCAVGGFFISIPVFLTGMILYTFIQFQSTPAIVTSVFIGLGIVFCGCALVHTVFVWQKEKTNAMKALRREQYEAAAQLQRQQTLQSQHQQLHQSQTQARQMQQQQQQQPQSQQQSRSLATPHGLAPSRLAAGIGEHHQQTPRGPPGPAPHQQQQQQPPPAHPGQAGRHLALSPPPFLLAPGSGLHHGPLNASLRGHHQLLGPASPPATPGDSSPTSPANRHHNRSQQLVPREATGSASPGLPAATLDLSSAANTSSPHELSTLV